MRFALALDVTNLHEEDPDLDQLDELIFGERFNPQREERRIPSRDELIAMTLEDSHEDDEPPMTCNDAFRIIEVIKEREAVRRRGR